MVIIILSHARNFSTAASSDMMRGMNLISMVDMSKTVKDAPLFSDVSLGIDLGERIGLIGENGSGKSTFLRLLTGELLPDDGTIARNRALSCSMLAQQPRFPGNPTVRQALYSGNSDGIRLLNRYHEYVRTMEHREAHSANQGADAAAQLSEITDAMDREHGWEIENNYISLLSELNIQDTGQRIDTLSGGMRKKVALARALASRPNLLILDEPTNHLDIDTIEWLERSLRQMSAGVIIVTHDRYFLDAACERIFEIDRGGIHTYRGNYSDFVTQRSLRDQIEAAGQRRIEAMLKTELEWLKRGPKARTGKDRGRRQRIQDLMDSRVAARAEAADFSSTHRKLGRKVLELHSVSKTYGESVVIRPFSYSFRQGERIGIIGPNGSGKSTLLDLITATMPPDSGSLDCGVHTSFGYYDQLNSGFSPEHTVLEYISEVAEVITAGNQESISAAAFLRLFGFPDSFHRIGVERLSGGERRRLYLIRILMGSPNFLVLDEPTNDLDLPTLSRLESYLQGFRGTLVIVSHDRAFLDRTTDFLFILDGSGSVSGFAGTYSQYHTGKELPEKPAAAGNANAARQESRTKERKRTLTFREQKEYECLLDEIDLLEQEKEALEHFFIEQPDSELLGEKTQRYHTLIGEIEEKSKRWEQLAEIAEA